MLARLAFAVAAFFAIVAAVGGHVTDNPQAWAIVFLCAGLLVARLPDGWPRR